MLKIIVDFTQLTYFYLLYSLHYQRNKACGRTNWLGV